MIRSVVALAIVAAIGVGVYFVFAGSSHADSIPTYRVERTSFVRRVHAEGNLRAVKSTPIAAPPGSARGPMKLAWLAPDGVKVKAGEVVVRFDPTDPEKQLRDGQADLQSAKAKLGSETIKGRAAVAIGGAAQRPNPGR